MPGKVFKSMGAFGRHLDRLAIQGPAVTHHLLTVWGKYVADDAKSRIGEYQRGWAVLTDRTIAEKTRLGYAPPDNPLLRTGEMRDSIGSTVIGDEAIVGATDIKALWHELGDVHLPPRPFIGPAAHESLDSWFENQAGVTVLAWIAGDGWKRVRAPK